MVKVAVTGGIGSGKSYICSMLEKRGIRIYSCDDAAKRLMATSEKIHAGLTALVGDNAYVNGVLNKPALTSFLLKSLKIQKRSTLLYILPWQTILFILTIHGWNVLFCFRAVSIS